MNTDFESLFEIVAYIATTVQYDTRKVLWNWIKQQEYAVGILNARYSRGDNDIQWVIDQQDWSRHPDNGQYAISILWKAIRWSRNNRRSI